jgi:hypothetical protein
MIFRCTAQFYRAFDSLSSDAQAATLKALSGFAKTPRVPLSTVRIACAGDAHEPDIWCAEIGATLRLTYSFVYDQHPRHQICILRHVAHIAAT